MIRKSTNDILIQTKVSPLVRVSRILGGILILIAIAYLSYSAGVKSGHAKFDSDRELITELNGKVGELKVELSDAGENLIIAQRHKQIQEEAYKQINAAYAGAEQKNRYLGSRLDFYRSIISPQDGQSGPAIQALEAKQQGEDLSFDVTLVQAIKHKHQIRGSLRVDLFDGDTKVGQWPANNVRSINFQYFQQLTGVIEGAQLSNSTRMFVQLSLQDGEVVERWFDLPKPA
jgi:hypothetical protein